MKKTKPKIKEPAYVAQTLAWCNARRKERGGEPLERLPKGKKEDPNSCPCGKATGLEVYCSYYLTEYHVSKSVPRYVSEFVDAFDGGLLPQYQA